MSKRHKLVDLSGFSEDEKAAIRKWIIDFQRQAPEVSEAAKTAQDVFNALLSEPTWTIRDAETRGGESPPPLQQWNIGPPKMVEVDHIEPIGRQQDG